MNRILEHYFTVKNYEIKIYIYIGVRKFKQFLINGKYYNWLAGRFSSERKKVVRNKLTAKKWMNQTIILNSSCCTPGNVKPNGLQFLEW